MLKFKPKAVAEDDMSPSTAQRKNVKKKKKRNARLVPNFNPLLDIPEYEAESSVRPTNNDKERKLSSGAMEKVPETINSKKRRKRKRKSSPLTTAEDKGQPKKLANEREEHASRVDKPSVLGVSRRKDKKTLEKPTWGIPKMLKTKPNGILESKQVQPANHALSLESAGGFDWDATPQDLTRVVSDVVDDQSESEDSEEDVPAKRKKMTPAEKRAKAVEEEKTMKRKEKELLEAEDNPQSPDHFERLLVGSPNSAELWIKYMGYHAVNADIDKARAVARRAIKRIDPQMTSAKLDVWIAFLNLEYTFSPPELFKETYSEALKSNDDYAINSRVLNLYAESKNVTEVDQLTNIMVKKYKTKVENWLQCQNALMTVGLLEKARNLIHRALTALTKAQHVTLISRFALLENKHGFPEQAQALFENLMTSFPHRLDLMSVYVDMLIKSQYIELARSVLERTASYQLAFRKMKSIYLKWIAFEEAHGTPSNLANVLEAAKKYISYGLCPCPNKKVNLETSEGGSSEIKEESGESEVDESSEGEEEHV